MCAAAAAAAASVANHHYLLPRHVHDEGAQVLGAIDEMMPDLQRLLLAASEKSARGGGGLGGMDGDGLCSLNALRSQEALQTAAQSPKLQRLSHLQVHYMHRRPLGSTCHFVWVVQHHQGCDPPFELAAAPTPL